MFVSNLALEELHFEGDLTYQLATFLLKSCLDLTKLTIRTSGLMTSQTLRLLLEPPRPHLREVYFAVAEVETDFAQV